MDHMPSILENNSLSINHEAEEDNDMSSVSDFSGDDHLDRSQVTDTLVTRPQSRQESQFDHVADVERNLTALPPMPLHHTQRIVSQSVSALSRNPDPQPKGTKSNTKKPRTPFEIGSTNCWICETLALLVSFLALMMIFLILYLYQGRSLQDWPCAITINSMVAVCSTVMKTALLVPVGASVSQAKWDWFHRQEGQILADMGIYDQASRGPWGALRMLTKIRWRHFSTLGAILIVLALAIDPMAQQVISYSQVQRSTAALIQDVTIPPSWGFVSNSNEMEPSMKGAVYSGLFGNSSNALAFASPTENYTWQYQSLAVCASCTDLTKSLDPTKHPGEHGLPNGLHLQKGDYLIIKSLCSKDLGSQIVNTSYIVNGPGDQGPHAAECAIYWCLKTYGIRADDKSTLVEIQSPRQNISAPQLSLNNTVYHLMPANTSGKPFSVDVQSSKRISEWMLSTKYRDEKSCAHAKDQPKSKDSAHKSYCCSEDDSFTYLNTDFNSSWNPISALVQPSTGSIEQKFDSIAAAMTDQIQSAPKPNQPMTFIGKAQVSTSQTNAADIVLIVHVQWAWLTLPSVLLILALILQIVTMMRTSRRKTPLWKSSALPLFFHGRAVQEGMNSTRGDDLAGMEDLAGRMKVRLENTGRCWRLTEEKRRMV